MCGEQQESAPEIISELIAKMPEGNGIRIEKDQETGNFNLSKLTVKDLFALNDRTDQLHVIALVVRTGAAYFYNYLEQTYFLPGTPVNDEYKYVVFKWNELVWAIGSIPIEKSHYADEAAKEAKMKLQTAIPFVVVHPKTTKVVSIASAKKDKGWSEALEEAELKAEWFPLSSNFVRTLENKNDSPVYNLHGGVQDAKIEEELKLQRLWEKMGRGPHGNDPSPP